METSIIDEVNHWLQTEIDSLFDDERFKIEQKDLDDLNKIIDLDTIIGELDNDSIKDDRR